MYVAYKMTETIICATKVSNGTYYLYPLEFQNTTPQKVCTGHVSYPHRRYTEPARIIKNTSLLARWPVLQRYNEERIITQQLLESGSPYCYYRDGYYRVQHTYIQHGESYIPILEWSSNTASLPHEYYILCHPAEKKYMETMEKYLFRVFHAEPVVITITNGVARAPVHIYRGLMEGALYRKDTCPISFEELSAETVCITPCFHVFEKESLRRSPGGRCPVCRTAYVWTDVVIYQS